MNPTYTFINIFHGEFTDKETGRSVKYRMVNVLDENDGKTKSLKVMRDFDYEQIENSLTIGDKVIVHMVLDSLNMGRVSEIEKA